MSLLTSILGEIKLVLDFVGVYSYITCLQVTLSVCLSGSLIYEMLEMNLLMFQLMSSLCGGDYTELA